MKKNKSWYSIIVIIVIIWFMLFLTTWIFRLIMNEMFNNRSLWNYIKAYSAAESWQELALLDIKENWYWSDKEFEKKFNNDKITIKFSNDWKIKEYTWKLPSEEYALIPLFYLDSLDDYKEKWISNYEVAHNTSWWVSNWEEIYWNLIWKNNWISWDWNSFDSWHLKELNRDNNNDTSGAPVEDFLRNSTSNYLQFYNTNQEKDFSYKITSDKEFFSPELNIISTWITWEFQINIETKIRLADLTSRSKYSIFSP